MRRAAADIQAYRKRVAQILRRAESQPKRGALLLKGEVGELLQELRRLSTSEPAVVLEVLLFLLDRLADVMGELEDGPGFASSLVSEVTERVAAILLRDARSGDQLVDHGATVEHLFGLWVDDAEGFFHDLDGLLLELTVSAAAHAALVARLKEHIRGLPLVFPPVRGDSGDLRRTLLLADRHRSERLLGEILARSGQTEYAVIVAQDHYRRTGDALDLVRSLHRADRTEDAITVARKALASPRSFQRQRIQEVLDDMVAGSADGADRQMRKELERAFVGDPSEKTFAALRKVVPPDQWPRVRKRVLVHLHKHQKAPTLLFRLYLEEGDVLEADGLVVVQPVEPGALVEGAAMVAAEEPAIAAGWLLFAAHHRVETGRPSVYPSVVRDLLTVRELSIRSNQTVAFARALNQFRERYSRRRRLLELLTEAGL